MSLVVSILLASAKQSSFCGNDTTEILPDSHSRNDPESAPSILHLSNHFWTILFPHKLYNLNTVPEFQGHIQSESATKMAMLFQSSFLIIINLIISN